MRTLRVLWWVPSRSVLFAFAAFAALAACGGDPAAPPDAAPPIDAHPLSDAPFLGCRPPTGPGTMHGGSVDAPETWTAADSPHNLPFDTSVHATITVEPCAIIRLGPGKTVTLLPGGALVATGLASLPVTIEALETGVPWATIRALGGDLSLTHVIVRDGGDPLNTLPALAGALRMQTTTTGTLHVEDVEIADSRSQGVYIEGNIGFDATSANLRVHGSVGFPVHVYARVIGSVPTGDYTGNGKDAIAIAGTGGPVLDAQTLHARGVPYHVGSGMDGGRMDVNSMVDGVVAVLTVEPGVTVEFPPGGNLNVDLGSGTVAAHGALVAIGTAALPIVFTSDQGATAMAGDWLGVGFGNVVDPRSVMQHVRVEFAGGPGTGSNSCPYPGRVGQNDAAIRIFGAPATEFITSTEVFASARDGIDRGWRADLQPDFLPGNTFTQVAGCKESTPRTAAGVCPAEPACP